MDKIESLYEKAERCNKKDHKLAKSLYEKVVEEIGNKPIHEMDDSELRFFALSKMRIFLSSEFRDVDSSEKAIHSFELYLERNDNDVEIYGEYILVLEMTHQYEKAKDVLISLFTKESMKEVALKFLSSYTYCAEKLQSFDECINYKKQLIDITADPMEKKGCNKN